MSCHVMDACHCQLVSTQRVGCREGEHNTTRPVTTDMTAVPFDLCFIVLKTI